MLNSLVSANEPAIGEPKIGWNGHYLVGRWTRVVVPATASQPLKSVQLDLSAVDPDGNRVRFLAQPVDLEAGQHQLEGFIKVGRLDGEVSVRVGDGPGMRANPGQTVWLAKPLKPSARLILTVGDPAGFDFDADVSKSLFKVIPVKSDELPTDNRAYDGVLSLVVAGSNNLSDTQIEAIKNWVAKGGKLVISLSQDYQRARQVLAPLESWLPVGIGDQPVTVREFGGLQAFAGKNDRIPQKTTLSIPRLQMDNGEVLAASRSDAFIVQAPYALGDVTVLAMDLTAAPMKDWTALPNFCARLAGLRPNVDVLEKTVPKSAQLSSTGISDLATQLNASQEHFEQVHRASPWSVMGFLLILLIVIGPVDYLLVHRILRRPHLTWVTFPCLIAASGFTASWLANSANGTSRRANQVDLIDVDVASARAYQKHFVTLYNPATVQSPVTINALPLTKAPKNPPQTSVVWQGVPETAFGGMFRESGLDQGADYQHQADGQLTQLPLIQWSAKALVAESAQSVEGLVESELQASPTGRLSGTITHHFPVDIEDWMLVYRNVVHRFLKVKDDPQSLPLPADKVWRVDQPRVFTRELKPYLTGAITIAAPRSGQPALAEASSHQPSYDPLSLDTGYVVRTLTFHEDIGGDQYTGLTNQLLGSEDLSRTLKLGRAVLFGRIKRRVAEIQVDQTVLEPDRESTFVRLILPVKRSNEVMKELRRLIEN